MVMTTITIPIPDDAYRALKAEMREGESCSDVNLRKFQRGNPAAIKAVFMEWGPDSELADAIEKRRAATFARILRHQK